MDEGHRSADAGILEGSQPAGLARTVAGDPRANGLDDQNVRQPGDHGLTARPQFPSLGGDEPESAQHPVGFGRGCPVARDDDRAGQQCHQVAGGWVCKADRAAHHPGGRPTAAVSQDRVAVAGVVVVQPVDPRAGAPGSLSSRWP